MSAVIEFYFDFISPNAYLAWHALPEIAAAHEREIVYRPVLFAALLQAHGQRGPAEVAPKMDWMVRNCLRKAKALGVELQPPATHPFNPLPALRACMAAGAAAERERVTGALFRATWAAGRDVGDAATVAAVLDESGLDGAAIIARTAAGAVKARLRAATDSAVANGIFGVPMFVADGEAFFGYDDLCWLDRHLGGQGTLDAGELRGWQRVRPSAWRRET